MNEFPILSWAFVDPIDSSLKANLFELVKSCFKFLTSQSCLCCNVPFQMQHFGLVMTHLSHATIESKPTLQVAST
jgi:hypothetical protein